MMSSGDLQPGWDGGAGAAAQAPDSIRTPGYFIPKGWGSFWLPKLAAAKAGTGQAVCAVQGDSIAGGAHYPSTISKSWIELLKVSLQGATGSARDGGSGYCTPALSQLFQNAQGNTNFATNHGSESQVVALTAGWTVYGDPRP